jgi:hypothetical protein
MVVKGKNRGSEVSLPRLPNPKTSSFSPSPVIVVPAFRGDFFYQSYFTALSRIAPEQDLKDNIIEFNSMNPESKAGTVVTPLIILAPVRFACGAATVFAVTEVRPIKYTYYGMLNEYETESPVGHCHRHSRRGHRGSSGVSRAPAGVPSRRGTSRCLNRGALQRAKQSHPIAGETQHANGARHRRHDRETPRSAEGTRAVGAGIQRPGRARHYRLHRQTAPGSAGTTEPARQERTPTDQGRPSTAIPMRP